MLAFLACSSPVSRIEIRWWKRKGLIPICGTETFGGGPDDRDPCACPEEDAICACLSRGSDLLLLFADDSQPPLLFAGDSHPLLRFAGRNRECLVRNSSVLRRLIPSVGTTVQASFTAVGSASIRSSIASFSSCSTNSSFRSCVRLAFDQKNLRNSSLKLGKSVKICR
jgi:hypothetical protein